MAAATMEGFMINGQSQRKVSEDHSQTEGMWTLSPKEFRDLIYKRTKGRKKAKRVVAFMAKRRATNHG